jgi:DNA-binding NarL/FixJ family response regulator
VSDAPISVLAVDDHPLFLGGLRTALADADTIELVGTAETGAGCVDLVARLQPDVVLMDIHLPDMDGIEATRRVVTASPATAVVVLTMFDEDDSVLAAIRAGARGYLLKGARQEEILRAVHAAAAGEALFGAPIAARLLHYFSENTAARAAFPQLSPRELEILEQIATGANNVAIARRLGVAEKTVRNSASTIFAKLQVADRKEAIVRARDAGLGRTANPRATGMEARDA